MADRLRLARITETCRGRDDTGDGSPKAVPSERTEVNAEAVLRCSPEAALPIARATKCTL